jgi:hypothetical protein
MLARNDQSAVFLSEARLPSKACELTCRVGHRSTSYLTRLEENIPRGMIAGVLAQSDEEFYKVCLRTCFEIGVEAPPIVGEP